jgi:hypothetical protein
VPDLTGRAILPFLRENALPPPRLTTRRDRHPEPFWRSGRHCWFVQIGTKSIKLHPDRDEAYRRYHELMSEPLAERKAPANPNASRQVVELLNAFIEWARKNKPPRTYVWNKENIQNFVDTIPATLTIAGLKPYHATHAMDAYPHWAAVPPQDDRTSLRRLGHYPLRKNDQGIRRHFPRNPLDC